MASRTRRTSPSLRVNGHAASSNSHSKTKNGARALVQNAPAVSSPKLNNDKQQEIFAAALHLFQQKGYHGASMQDLADAVGIQKASLYY